jgi:hypothetical protein
MTVPVDLAGGALGLYSAVGDAFAGRRLGFGRRRAAVAARFARHRGRDDDAVAANWVAGALAEIGLVAIALPSDVGAQHRALAYADAPLHAARIIAAFPGLPAPASDIARWYREQDDGTGFPDGLRWDGIPADAAGLGIAHAFLELIEDPAEPRDAMEASFSLAAESGRRFAVELGRAFREFVVAGDWDEPDAPAFPAINDDAAIRMLAQRIDARDAKTEGRSERLATRGRALAKRLALDEHRIARLVHLLALGRATEPVPHDDFDPFSRFARESRTALAQRAGAIAGSVAGFAADAQPLAASATWHEDGNADLVANVLALLVAVDVLNTTDAPRRLAAASGTQFAPEITRAYLGLLNEAP